MAARARRPRRSRLVVVAAAVAAVAFVVIVTAGLVAIMASGRDDDSGRHQAQRPRTSGDAYQIARRRGQPIVEITKTTRMYDRPGGKAIGRLHRRTTFGAPTVLAAISEQRGWLRVIASQLPNDKRGWIPPNAGAAIDASPWEVRVDLSAREATVTRHGVEVRRFPVAIGAPATPTPTGRFSVTDKLKLSGPDSANYGCCILALSGHQLEEDPGWTGGDRLAIHATGAQWTVGQAVSHGCMRAHDADARWMTHHLLLGTLVTIRE